MYYTGANIKKNADSSYLFNSIRLIGQTSKNWPQQNTAPYFVKTINTKVTCHTTATHHTVNKMLTCSIHQDYTLNRIKLILLEAIGWTFALLCTAPDAMSAHQRHVIKLYLKTMRSQLSTANKHSFHIQEHIAFVWFPHKALWCKRTLNFWLFPSQLPLLKFAVGYYFLVIWERPIFKG